MLTLAQLRAILAAAALTSAAAGAAIESESIREQMDAFTKANQPEGENAWPLLERAIADLEDIKREFTPHGVIHWDAIYNRRFRVHVPIDEVTLRDTPRALSRARDAGVHERLFLAAERGRLVFPQDEIGTAGLAYLTSASQVRDLVGFMAAVTTDALDREDAETAIAALNAGLFLSWGLSQHATLSPLLMALATQSLLINDVARANIAERSIPAEVLRGWLDVLDRWRLRSVSAHLELEAALAAADWAGLFDREGNIPPQRQARLLELLELGLTPDLFSIALKRELDDAADLPDVPEEVAKQFPTLAELKEWVNTAAMRAKALLSDPPVTWSEPDPVLDEEHLFSEVLETMTRAFWQAGLIEFRHAAHLDGARVMIALELHKHQHGRYPDDLAALAPTVLREVPRDPFTGGSFIYRRITVEGEADDSYVLYSLGANNTDNGGQPCLPPSRAWILHTDAECDGILHKPSS